MKTNMAQTSLDTCRSLPVSGYLQPKEAELVASHRLEEIDGGVTRSGRPAKLVRLFRVEQGSLFGLEGVGC